MKAGKANASTPLPAHVKPMLATLTDRPFDDADWTFEVKWDGYRAIALMDHKKVFLQSRNDKSFNEKFYPIFNALVKSDLKAVLDGEIVVINQKGMSDFGALQNWRSETDGELIYYVFDILWKDGKDLKNLPLFERKDILRKLVFSSESIRISEGFDQSGINLFKSVKKMGLEGIIAKNRFSSYQENARPGDWLKIKSQKRQEVVIGGYTLNRGTDKLFSSLLVGVYKEKKLLYTGKIGTGFNRKMQEDLIKQFKPLITGKVPFSFVPDIEKPSRFRPHPPETKAVWIQPKLICEVSFTEMTSDGVMRHPSFAGMRTDKKASEIIWETETPKEKIRKSKSSIAQKPILMAPKNSSAKSLLNPKDETQVKKNQRT